MPIEIGHKSSDEFARVPNMSARDVRLSFRARGILTYLLSHTSGWRTSIKALTEQGVEGREAVAKALRELDRLGYIERIRRRDASGRITTVTIVNDRPRPTGPQEPVSR